MLAASISNSFGSYVRPTNAGELNMFSILPHLKPETQQLYRTLIQHFGSNPVSDVSSTLSQPHITTSGSLKRSSPVDTRPSVNAHENGLIQSPNSLINPSNLSMTTAITNALCANSVSVGPHILPACSPLLQLAVRQALGACLSSFGKLTIRGNLEISVTSNQFDDEHTTNSTTVLKFSDRVFDSRLAQSETTQTFDDGNCPSISPITTSAAAAEAITAITQKHAAEGGVGSSRRKSMNPIKCSAVDLPNGTLCSAFASASSPTTTSPIVMAGSAPTSPSTDSGVLDLSRNGSLAGSAPITPMKEFPVHGEVTHTLNQQQMLEAYQKQLATLSQLQYLWSRIPGSYIPGDADNEVNSFNLAARINQHLEAYSGPLSVPSSPIKSVRRRVISRTAASTGRMCPLRRPSSNRRFPCNQCREEFPSLHTLEEHTMFKHGTYRCHICKAQFTQRSNLQRHALKHVGFKPFECRVCSKAYYRKDHLMRHMEMGHPGYTPRENITVHLTSSESLDFLNRTSLGQTNDGSTVLDDSTPTDAHDNTIVDVQTFSSHSPVEMIPNSASTLTSPNVKIVYHEERLTDGASATKCIMDYSTSELSVPDEDQQPIETPESFVDEMIFTHNLVNEDPLTEMTT